MGDSSFVIGFHMHCDSLGMFGFLRSLDSLRINCFHGVDDSLPFFGFHGPYDSHLNVGLQMYVGITNVLIVLEYFNLLFQIFFNI